jgi:hypothetical protein
VEEMAVSLTNCGSWEETHVMRLHGRMSGSITYILLVIGLDAG